MRKTGVLFYEKLFERAPQVRSLFPENIFEQSLKLMAMIGEVVNNLENLDYIRDDIRQMALRHQEYGAKPGHYNVVGEVLLDTFGEMLAEHWTPETEDAWRAAYQVLASAMKEAR